jgi:glutathione S-transferase
MIKLYYSAFGLKESAMDKAASAELATVLGYIEELLDNGKYLFGELFTVADIQISFIPELATAIGCAGEHSVIGKWQ